MRYLAQLATFGQLTIGPAPDVQSRVDVCRSGVSATSAEKFSLRLPIRFLCVSTFAAFTAGIARVNERDGNTCEGGLVLQKGAKLKERPAMQNGTLLTPNRDAASDALQFFEGDSSSGALSGSNDLPGNAVVGISRETRFAARELLEFAAAAARAVGLKPGAKFAVPIAHVVDGCSRHEFAIAGSDDSLHSKIASEKVVHGLWVWVGDIAGRGQIKLVAMKDQVAFALLRFQEFLLAVPGGKWNAQTPRGGPNTDGTFFVAKDSGVVTDRAVPAESPLSLPVEFVSIPNFSKDANHHLGGKSEPQPRLIVEETVKRILSKHLALPCLLADPVRAGIRLFDGMQQRGALFRISIQPYFCREFQYLNYTTRKGNAIPLPPKVGSPLA